MYIHTYIYAHIQTWKCNQELDSVQIHIYFRSKYKLAETSMLEKRCLKYPSKVCTMKWKGIFVLTQ